MITKRDVVASMLSVLTLFMFWAAGWLLSLYLPLPASLLGLLLLFLCCVILGRVPTFLLSTSQFLLRHLSLFFIAPLVGAWLYAGQLGERVWLFLGVIVVTTWISLWLTSWISVGMLKLADRTREKGKDA